MLDGYKLKGFQVDAARITHATQIGHLRDHVDLILLLRDMYTLGWYCISRLLARGLPPTASQAFTPNHWVTPAATCPATLIVIVRTSN
eukprot:COSAG01_NODE_12301_length_1763_cov_1342.703125_1_plen_88_part_00